VASALDLEGTDLAIARPRTRDHGTSAALVLAMAAHPENRRNRRELRGPRRGLIAVLLGVAVLAFTHPTAPLVVLAVVQALAAAALVIHATHARAGALAAALFAIACAGWQVIGWNEVTWFQIALLALGSLEALLVAGCTPRDAGAPRRWRRQRQLSQPG
jgi:hypothetical protein